MPGPTLIFDGTRVDLIGAKGPTYGHGTPQRRRRRPRHRRLLRRGLPVRPELASFDGLTNGRHVLSVEWTGSSNASSTGTFIGIDAIDVVGTLAADTVAPVDLREPDRRLDEHPRRSP